MRLGYGDALAARANPRASVPKSETRGGAIGCGLESGVLNEFLMRIPNDSARIVKPLQPSREKVSRICYMFAQPENNSFQSQRKAAHRRASVGKLGKYSPASTLCMYRGLTPIFSANSSWVSRSRTRKEATFFPSRFRWGQDSGLRTGIPEASEKSTKPNTRLYIVLPISVVLERAEARRWTFPVLPQRIWTKFFSEMLSAIEEKILPKIGERPDSSSRQSEQWVFRRSSCCEQSFM